MPLERKSSTPLGSAMRDNRTRLILVAAMLAIGVAWLPVTLRSDIRGARSNLELSPAAAADARGPSAAAGTNIALVHAARERIPEGETYAIVRGGRWGSTARPTRSLAFVWQAGESWTQFSLAPRVEVDPAVADWILARDADPRDLGFAHPAATWSFGPDSLVKTRR
jgi:hypothetical protein